MTRRPRPRYLKVGQKFRMHPDCGDTRLHEVVRVTPGAATVRCIEKSRVDFDTADGEAVGFDKPGRRFQIAPTAFVILEEES